MPTSANCPKNPSDVRADVDIRAPILPLSQQPLVSAIFEAREDQKVLRELMGYLTGVRAVQRICCSSRLISFLSSAPTRCFAR